MRIPHWPALVCGWMLAATISQTVFAAGPVRPVSGGMFQADDADADDELDDEDITSSRGFSGSDPYETLQYAAQEGFAPAPPSAFDPGPGPYSQTPYAPGMGAPEPWPQDTLYNQHRVQQTFNNGGLWEYQSDDNFARKWIFRADYLYGYGLKPGPHYIGSNGNHALTFLPGNPGPFPTQTTELFGNVFHNGMKLWAGYDNPDGSGLMLSGFWLFENSVDNGLVSPHAISGQPSTLRAGWGIVVDNPDGTGTVLPFDTRFYQRFTQQIVGADADYYLAPFFERQSFQLRMLYGAKYLRVHEDFYVQGDNSGLTYGVTAGGTGITGPFVPGVSPYSTVIQSGTTSNFVGPNIGLRYDLGGKKFKIWGQSKLAVAADVERLTVASNNVAPIMTFGPPATVPNVLVNPAVTSVGPSNFHQRTNTHIAPIFDTSIFIEFPGFELIPYVNKMNFFKNAMMRVGWNYVLVDSVARPPIIINYNVNDPTIHSAHTWFEYSTVNFAIDWKW